MDMNTVGHIVNGIIVILLLTLLGLCAYALLPKNGKGWDDGCTGDDGVVGTNCPNAGLCDGCEWNE